jgi:hypothetical protein
VGRFRSGGLRRDGTSSRFIIRCPGFVPVHVLLVPKLALPSLRHLTEGQRAQIAAEVERLAPEALANLGRSPSPFLVFVNGGRRQDVRQVHFHLVTDGYDLAHTPAGLQSGAWTEITDPACGRGYSIVWDARAHDSEGVVHLTAGMP